MLIDINECEILNENCLISNTERCVDTDGSFRCICKPGWFGKYCQSNIDDCQSNTCLNEGECLDLVNDYKCLCKRGFKGRNCEEFDESVCESSNKDEYWEIQTLNNSDYWVSRESNEDDCRSKWCACLATKTEVETTKFQTSLDRHLMCACINEKEYKLLNKKQLEKLNLILNPTVDQLMLIDNKDSKQQNFLLEQLPIRLKKQTIKNLIIAKFSKANEQKVEHRKADWLVNEVLIDSRLDSGDELFVSLTLNFNQALKSNQTESICSSMLSIYSLIRNQSDFKKLNFACKSSSSENNLKTNTSTIRFYTLDNDERVLLVADIIGKSVNNQYNLESILKRTYRLTNSTENQQLTRWQVHCLLVLNICIVFWLIVIIIIIYILLTTHNESLRTRLGENNLLDLISLQMNKRLYRRTNRTKEDCEKNRVIHNRLNNHFTKNSTTTTIINQLNLIEQNRINRFKELDNENNTSGSSLMNKKTATLLNDYLKDYLKDNKSVYSTIKNQNDYSFIKNKNDNHSKLIGIDCKINNNKDDKHIQIVTKEPFYEEDFKKAKIIKPVHL